jgi:hypothetical protein
MVVRPVMLPRHRLTLPNSSRDRSDSLSLGAY